MTQRRERDDISLRWHDVEVRAYKPDAEDTWKDLTRQVLFESPHMDCEVRFFDVAPGGHTTLERHKHAHAVIVLDGHGECLVADQIHDLRPHDLIETLPFDWHQFRAAADEHLAFVCIVDKNRDRPQLATNADLENLARHPAVAAFLDGRLGGEQPER